MYESHIQELNNKLKQNSINSNVALSTQTVVIPGPVIEEPIFHKSDCAVDPKEKEYFQKIMKNRKFRTVISYKGSRDGWKKADFHRMSDKKGPTVTLFKIKDNYQCIGGFTTAQWASPETYTYVSDSTAMLFNLTTCNEFKVKDHTKAIRCGKGYGPCFG